jgi:hypothetical protein
VWKRKLADKNLVKKLQIEAMDMRQQNNMSIININTAKARLEDLTGQINMAHAQLKDVLTDKSIVDKQNQEMELIIQGKGQSEAEQKAAEFEAEREQTNRLNHSLQYKTEEGNTLSEQLKEEEAKAKDMLDIKINCEQEMEIVEEDAATMAQRRAQNKEDLIRAQIRQSQLKKANERAAEDLAKKTEENAALIKNNDELDLKNEKLDKEITELV